MNRLFVIPAIFLLFALSAHAQEVPYFQQEVHYRIDAKLDDKLNQLQVMEELVYINNSPETLDYLFFNLWPNSHLNRETALSKQFIRLNNDRFYFAKAEELGGFLELDFQISGTSLDWSFDPDYLDIARIELPGPLAPGDSVRLEIPFLLQIPGSFSRIGHVGESYQMTQWYPKPAVYDRDGWHAMPYLDQGEFYSEFGSFDVSISLPANYLVGATGVLQNESEWEFLREEEAKSRAYLEEKKPEKMSLSAAKLLDTIPPSAERQKTIRYLAENVHDFAWFADKRFRVLHKDIELPSGKTIDGWVFFTLVEEWYWQDALTYLERAVLHYSELVGEYPWPQVTALQSALSAGGGMEYPMITVIGYAGDPQGLDEVITHEVGHNWFYGILGSNERRHAWMDEGLNSFHDQAYTIRYYDGLPGADYFLPGFIAKGSDLSFYEIAYLYFSRSGREQIADTHSDSLFSGAYYLAAYEKPARSLRHLEAYLGADAFREAIHTYYENWKFKHPDPADFQASLEQSAGESLDWFFDGFLYSTRVQDYRLSNAKVEGDTIWVTVQNRGQIPAPFPIAGIHQDSIVGLTWYPGFTGKRRLAFPNGDYEKLQLDPEFKTVEYYRVNNQAPVQNKLAVLGDFKLKFLTGIDHSVKRMIYWTPLVAWNDYDKWMFGLGIHNYSLVERQVEYGLFPMYSPLTNQLNGRTSIHFNSYFRDSDQFRRLRLGGVLQQFSNNYNWRDAYYQKYLMSRVYARLDLENPASRSGERYFQLSATRTSVERSRGIDEVESLRDDAVFLGLKYRSGLKQAINEVAWELNLESKVRSNHLLGSEPYLKVFGELTYNFTYQRFRDLQFRVFAGGFLSNAYRDRGLIFPWSIDLASQGAGDYLYDSYFFGRSDQAGPWWQQRMPGEGGFYSALPPAYRGQSGSTNNFLIAFNFLADLPKPMPRKLPIKPFFNMAYSDDARPIASEKTFGDQLWWEAGLSLEVFDGQLGLAFPLLVSSQLDALFDQNGQTAFYQRMSFTINLAGFNPVLLREKIAF
ncbi:MAG: M1 family metallopeptidase [Saprospiraceae bacterium]|nr:M1 family metallopeptidase [Saprospiraceae bacterium]